MFTVRNYVIAGKENSGGSLGLCLPLPADFVFPEALNMWLCAHSRGCALGTAHVWVTYRMLTLMACLNSSPFPND